MRPMPFRLRIALLSALVSGVVLAVFGAACWYWIGRAKLESVDTQIRSLGARHPGWFANRGNYERLNSASNSSLAMRSKTNHSAGQGQPRANPVHVAGLAGGDRS
jgi:hypothetical protein